ncbi:MAG TPA: hypothetical protein PLD46_06660, partial [Hyphomicrobium sp.]|nr:hypothetical protein [Hyphomicrobium sp.]
MKRFLVFWLIAALTPAAAAAPRVRAAKPVVEFAPYAERALKDFELEVVSSADGITQRLPVTDGALFVSKAGGDAEAQLVAPNGQMPSSRESLFAVRFFIVAGGKLYSGGRGRCGAWDGDVSHCVASCDDGRFALRRNGAAPLELLLGAIPGGVGGTGGGIAVSECGFEEDGGA